MSNKSVLFLEQAAEYAKQIDYSRPAGSQVYGFIRDAIVSMQLEPGQLIS